MAITNITELSERDDASVNSDGEFVLNRAFKIEVDSPSQTGRSILAEAWAGSAPGVAFPLWKTVHPSDNQYFADTFRITRISGTRIVWNVILSYKSAGIETGGGGTDPGEVLHPTELPARVSYGTGRAITKDISLCYRAWFSDATVPALDTQSPRGEQGIAIVNSALEEFDPGIADSESLFNMSISRNEREDETSPDNVESYQDTINFKAIKVAGIQIEIAEGLMVSVRMEERYDMDGLKYYESSYNIEVRRGGHYRRILDRGYNSLDGSLPTPIQDADNKDVTEPQMLDGIGGKLTAGLDPISLIAQTKYARIWDNLKLPE